MSFIHNFFQAQAIEYVMEMKAQPLSLFILVSNKSQFYLNHKKCFHQNPKGLYLHIAFYSIR